MPLKINTNLQSLQAAMGLNTAQERLKNVQEKLSSGLEINRASDGAADLARAMEMHAEQRSNMQAQRNTHDGLSMLHTAEGATGSVGNMLSEMRTLAVQASSETINDEQRAMINEQINQYQSEINRVAGATTFNGVQLADGSTSELAVQVGTSGDSESRVKMSLKDLRTSSLGVDSVNVSTSVGARDALGFIDSALDGVNQTRSNYGAYHNRLSASVNNLETSNESTAAALSRIMDADYAFQSAEQAKSEMLLDFSVAATAQAGKMNNSAVRLIS